MPQASSAVLFSHTSAEHTGASPFTVVTGRKKITNPNVDFGRCIVVGRCSNLEAGRLLLLGRHPEELETVDVSPVRLLCMYVLAHLVKTRSFEDWAFVG